MNKLVIFLLASTLSVSGCTSIITYIKNDNRHDNNSCETSEGSQGLLDVDGNCTIEGEAK
ncbi:TPA: hypothetical protein L3N15_004218 [Vibrio parahaemolyticus]|uniref:hypothetical protein n=1 Tax=Vibrio parahaemolyticus TaxID=670 RepID=UPI000C9CF9A7|nr:hypothetical protein [Vibrio parahaemolyticus]PMS91981.1 hypothetical protein C1T06_23100 [Vibrio parahaemolyticus]HBN6266236.1 hypothetical protein [Vibrio parahaemolyticus]